MIVRKAFRYRIYPTRAQARLLAWEGALRFLWNLALEQRKMGLGRPRDERVFLTAFDQINELTELRSELEGTPKSCTLRREGDQWFAAILCEIDVPEPAQKTQPAVALDRGIVNLVGDSNGNLVPNPAHLERALKRLARAQRIVSRRKKGSKNRKKAIDRVSRLHRKIRRQREHVLHSLSSTYAKSHGTVIVERLQITNMVQANSGLARRILDSGWGRLVEMLRYKLAWQGGRLIEVPAAHSSQSCSACGHVDARSRSAERFCCTACGHSDHADLNAAKVLKSRANRSALPLEGSLPESARRRGKVVVLRVPRRPPQSSAL